MEAECRAIDLRRHQHCVASSADEIFRAALEVSRIRTVNDQIRGCRLLQAHDITDIGEGQQATDWMISVRAGRSDMQVKVDLGRREAEAFLFG
jgi:hypothetical protein